MIDKKQQDIQSISIQIHGQVMQWTENAIKNERTFEINFLLEFDKNNIRNLIQLTINSINVSNVEWLSFLSPTLQKLWLWQTQVVNVNTFGKCCWNNMNDFRVKQKERNLTSNLARTKFPKQMNHLMITSQKDVFFNYFCFFKDYVKYERKYKVYKHQKESFYLKMKSMESYFDCE